MKKLRSFKPATLLSLFLFTLCHGNLFADWEVVVSSESSQRRGTPVSVEVKTNSVLAQAVEGKVQLVAKTQGSTSLVQAEKVSPILTRLWWIVDRLAPGQALNYKITAGEKSDAKQVFTWKDSSKDGKTSTDLLQGERPVLRYMHTAFDPKNIEITKKIFHMVFSPDGSRLITKGAGGLYPHHRGIYFGYNRCQFDGKSFDTWHAHKGEHQLHKSVLKSFSGPVFGGHQLEVDWNDREGKAFIKETRTLKAFSQPDGTLLIEFQSELNPLVDKIKLTGDRQHAGVQFRAAQEVADNQKKTRYLRPKGWDRLDPKKQYNDKKHMDLPWNAVQYDIGDQGYTVAYLSDPKNPAEAEFSERLYGRFGEFFHYDLTKEKPLKVRYRWWIKDSRKVSRQDVDVRYSDLAQPVKVSLK